MYAKKTQLQVTVMGAAELKKKKIFGAMKIRPLNGKQKIYAT
jgi:hypothetical protein